jgi:hypothetical protein
MNGCRAVRVATARDVRYSSLCCRRSAAVHGRLPEWPKGTVCKTVGSAYVGSNPTPATLCENGPLAANSRAGGPFLLCLVVCHLVSLRAAVSRCPRTHGGRASVAIRTVGAHRRRLHGRPRTGHASSVFWLDVRLEPGLWDFDDRVDGVALIGHRLPVPIGNAGLDDSRRTQPSCRRPAPHGATSPVTGAAGTRTASGGTDPRAVTLALTSPARIPAGRRANVPGIYLCVRRVPSTDLGRAGEFRR